MLLKLNLCWADRQDIKTLNRQVLFSESGKNRIDHLGPWYTNPRTHTSLCTLQFLPENNNGAVVTTAAIFDPLGGSISKCPGIIGG
jgi:hypothetical protein